MFLEHGEFSNATFICLFFFLLPFMLRGREEYTYNHLEIYIFGILLRAIKISGVIPQNELSSGGWAPCSTDFHQ